MIRAENLCKKYRDLEVLGSISTQIKKGGVAVLIEPNGGGKSTLLYCPSKLELADSGKILIKGESILDKEVDINKICRKVDVVFQHFSPFANRNVPKDLILTPIKTGILSQDETTLRAEVSPSKVGLADEKAYTPYRLSDDRKQHIAIARSLMMNPDVILFDEPTSALNPEMIGEVLSIIKDLAKEDLTMLVVTYEMGFAKNVTNRVFFMDKGQIVVDESPIDVLENPKDERFKEFLNKVLNH